MKYSNLYDLIKFLEYGTKLHIGVLLFGSYGNEKLTLPFNNTIHKNAVCDRMKELPNGLRRCKKCRDAAIEKAIRAKEVFGGTCINGVYEYTRPITVNGETVGVIFIGNILPDDDSKLKRRLKRAKSEVLTGTLEREFGFDKCDAMGALIESYIRMMPQKRAEQGYDPLTENLKTYIDANLEYKIDLMMMARIFHYNEKYLGRFFKKQTGLSFSEYTNSKRMERAKALLEKSDDTVIDIATKVGFNNVTYFNRVFKTYYGMTPTEYRKL